MASINWPATLPKPLSDSYAENAPDGTIRTNMDSGPAKMRRRYTAAPRPFALVMHLTSAQYATFDGFFVSTSRNGSLRFNFTHPRTGSACEARFVGAPTYGNPLGTECDVSFKIEVLP